MLQPGRRPRDVVVAPQARVALEYLARRPGTAQKHVARAQIVLAAAEGQRSVDIAHTLGVHKNSVWKWRLRWAAAQAETWPRLLARLEPDGTPCPPAKLAEALAREILDDAPRSGAPPRVHR